MTFHTDEDWKSGLASAKNHALATMIARDESIIEQLHQAVEDAVGDEKIWRQIAMYTHSGNNKLTIRLPTHYPIEVSHLSVHSSDVVYWVRHRDTRDIFTAIVLADRKIQYLLARRRRQNWTWWQRLVWLISFTLAEIP